MWCSIRSVLRQHTRKLNRIEEMLMALQDDYNTLSNDLDTLSGTIDAIATDLTDLTALVKKLQDQNPSIDLSPLVTKAEAIRDKAAKALSDNPDPGGQ
jgi:chromosome segregation ATPase